MRTNISAIGAIALLATAGTAQAGSFIGTDFEEGRENQTITVDGIDVHLNADPRGVAYIDDGTEGIGVFGGGGDAQIGSVDEFNFAFSQPVIVHKLVIGQLFGAYVTDDIWDETVAITTDHGTWEVSAADVVSGTVFTDQDFGGDLVYEGNGSWCLTDNGGDDDDYYEV